jgi:hypothetical protein
MYINNDKEDYYQSLVKQLTSQGYKYDNEHSILSILDGYGKSIPIQDIYDNEELLQVYLELDYLLNND